MSIVISLLEKLGQVFSRTVTLPDSEIRHILLAKVLDSETWMATEMEGGILDKINDEISKMNNRSNLENSFYKITKPMVKACTLNTVKSILDDLEERNLIETVIPQTHRMAYSINRIVLTKFYRKKPNIA
ncbi:MAG: hypothetical protein OHK0017_07250 [Patescibacteria group bacterium]